jgi:hypothetical protein
MNFKLIIRFIIFLIIISQISILQAQPLKTPLPQETLTLLTNEISGQMIFNNEVFLAGAPWVRNPKEFTDTFYESEKIYELVKNYGIETTELQRYPGQGQYDYPTDGEFWLMEPQEKLIARIGADAALINRGSQSVDITSELIYLPPLSREQIDHFRQHSPEKYKGKIALMWSHPRGNLANSLDSLGIQGIISFSSRDRYLDPNQVVYGRGTYNGPNLKFGLSISWRQWTELLEDVEAGKKLVVRCKTKVETFPDKFETVFSWIPGTEPNKKGVVFTAHLFEGYTKRGANDNMSGCVIQLEILRALTKLIKNGNLPQPRRTIYFIWPNEISGTFEFMRQNPGFIDKLSININMDMVGEALRKNNSWFTMSECPNHLPSYLDGLAKSIMNYVWRTNDIVYLPDSPRGRSGGQYFPIPMMEKNGSTDAFRFYIHRATGGSDHICFNNSSVAVPGIEFFTWPDQWYHADTDTPDKSDPTQMKRVAFIGAACAYVAANCTDEVLSGLLVATTEFGYSRIAEREHPKALQLLDSATENDLNIAYNKALNLINFATTREISAVESIKEIYTHSDEAKKEVNNRVQQFKLFLKSIQNQLIEYGKIKAKQLQTDSPTRSKPTSLEKKYSKIIPTIHPNIKGKEFRLTRSQIYLDYLKKNPDSLRNLGLDRNQTASILNFINGQRSITTICKHVNAETGKETALENVISYLDILKSMKWIEF